MTLFVPVGRLATEPSTRQVGSGRTCCTFSLAADTGVKDGNGQKISNFLNCTVWGKLAEIAQNNLHKGDAVSITGKFCARQYESKKDGQQKTSLDLNVTDIDFLPGGKKSSDSAPQEDKPKRRRPVQQADDGDDEELPF